MVGFKLRWIGHQYLSLLAVVLSCLLLPQTTASGNQFCNNLNKNFDGKTLGLYTWKVPVPTTSSTVRSSIFYLSFCQALNFTAGTPESACNGASACRVTTNINGKKDIDIYATYNETQEVEIKNNFLFLSGGVCNSPGSNTRTHKVAIQMKCGHHLTPPIYLIEVFCQVIFEWRTSAACAESADTSKIQSDDHLPKIVKVPCYVVDDTTGIKYDLSHLTKSTGYHKVETSNRNTLYINVCQNIIDPMMPCGPGVAACMNIGDMSWRAIGKINSATRVEKVGDGASPDLKITYTSATQKTFANCSSPPNTVVIFRCPKKRGRSRPPRLVAEISCQYLIEWETDHACPEHYILGDPQNCSLNVDNQLIDLKRLRKPGGYQNVKATLSDQNVEIWMDICGAGLLGDSCGTRNNSLENMNICYKDKNGYAINLGHRAGATLRYTDGKAILVYPDGSICHEGSNRKWTTIVEFICDSDHMLGEPYHIRTDDDLCIIDIEWRTVAACIPDVIIDDDEYNEFEETCVLRDGDLHLDLFPLRDSTGSWSVIGSDNFTHSLVVDVCSAINSTGPYQACPPDSAVCGILNSNHSVAVRYGRFSNASLHKVGDKPVASIVFGDGDECPYNKSKRLSTEMHMVCIPGATNYSPRLVGFDHGECVLHLEWHTAVACPQIGINGNSCVVEDKVHGFKIDLNPLASSGIHTIHDGEYEYHISACKALPATTKCPNGTSICREKISDNTTTALAKATKQIVYNGGMVTLVFDGNSTSIVFVCDLDRGVGTPQVFEVQNGTVVFIWPTSFACPSINSHVQSCAIHDAKSGNNYDLSLLNRMRPDEDWNISTTYNTGTQKISLNVHLALCRPLRNPPIGCNPLSSSCIEVKYPNGTRTFVDSGRAVASPKFIGEQLALEYSNGDPCTAYGLPNYSKRTIVHFLCNEDNPGETIQFLGFLGECTMSLLWYTEAACPVKNNPVHDSCTVVDRLSGDVYNITHMRSPTFYTEGQYEFNICGPISGSKYCPGSNVGVCYIHKNNTGTPIAAASGFDLDFMDRDSVILTYYGVPNDNHQERAKVEIMLACTSTNNKDKKEEIEALGIAGENNLHRINVYSSGVCPQQKEDLSECQIAHRDNDHIYDLRPLARNGESNWEVIGLSPFGFEHAFATQQKSGESEKFHFNICKKMNNVTSYNCPGGSFACLTNEKDPKGMGISLGRHLDTIMFGEDDSIAIKYIGGDACPAKPGETTPRFRSSMITLSCAPKEHDVPRLAAITDDCEYVFYMETPAACPSKTASGDKCRVQEPNYGYTFDLNALVGNQSSPTVYNVENPDGKGIHKLSVCNPMPNAKVECGDERAASCLTVKGQNRSLSLGRASSKLTYNTGILSLVYTDGIAGCKKPSELRTTTINFLCDQTARVGSTAPQYEGSDDNCGYIFNWYTELACTPYTIQDCMVSTPEGLVDLTPLSNSKDNYIAGPSDESTTIGDKFVINVCRSVVHQKALMCAFNAGACQIGAKATRNLGIVRSRPTYEAGRVHIRYTNGDACLPPVGRSGKKYETDIEFTCSESDASGPVHMYEDECVNYFLWSTPHACPRKSSVVPYRNKTCTAINPVTNSVIDLTSLARADNESPYLVSAPNGVTYHLNICGAAHDTSCGSDTGICYRTKNQAKKVAGVSSNLFWDEGVLALSFTGGDACGLIHEQSTRNMSAIIHFVCPSAGFSSDKPYFVSQSHDDCLHRFVWPTELACQNTLQCSLVDHMDQIDLSPLSTRPHQVKNIIDQDHQYYLSVCKPLEPRRPYQNMKPNAAAVRVSNNGKDVESLGYAFLEPFTDFEQTVSLLYINGSKCEWDPNQSNKARIIFQCDDSQDAGEPVLLEIDPQDCVYVFRWRTNMVCGDTRDSHSIAPRDNCTFEIPQKGIVIDLTPLSKRSPYPVKVDSPDGKAAGNFTLSLCRSTNKKAGCNGAGLCYQHAEGSISFGHPESYHYQGTSLFVKYGGGDKCVESYSNRVHSAIIEFECDPLHGDGRPVVEKQYACVTIFKWKTSLACSKQLLQETHDCVVTNGAQTYDLSMLSSVSHVWTAIDGRSKDKYYLNVCGIGWSWPLDALDVCPNSGACVEKKGEDAASKYSSLGSYNSRKTEIIGNGHIRITYNGGEPSFCPGARQHPTTVIDLKCVQDGDTVGTPTLVTAPSSTNCTFEFEWPTRSACLEKNDEMILHKDGLLIDPSLGQAFDISGLMNKTFTVLEGRNENDNYTYNIYLGDSNEPKKHNFKIGQCSKSAVCQTKKMGFMKNIGSHDKKKFVLRGRELILEIDTGSYCGDKKTDTIKTLISFSCDNSAGQGKPAFLYESRGCHYVFSWKTSYVCQSQSVHPFKAGPGSEDGGSSRTGLVLILTICVLLMAGTLMFLSKPDNRMIAWSRVTRLFRTVTMPHYYYSKTESEMQSPLDNDGDTVLLSPSLVLQPDDDDFSPLA